jgi:uncharacterized iron-regulated membrane protein
MNRVFRKWHRIISLFIAVPFSITLISGLIMTTRSFNTWVQPDYPVFKAELKLSFADVLKISQGVSEAGIKNWNDVSQIDIRPATGNIRVRSKINYWEIQINGETGAITSSAPRRQSFLSSLHEGAYFGSFVRYGLFLPSALGILFLMVSGMYLAIKFYIPLLKKRASDV